MRFFRSLISNSLLLLVLGSSVSAQASSCPNGATPDRYITTANGQRFAVCLNADFKGGDIADVPNIGSPEQLAEACSTNNGCVAATLSRTNGRGYLKNTQNTVTANGNVDSVYKVTGNGNTNGVCANGADSARTITTSNGGRFGVCLNTDFKGGDFADAGGVTSVDQLAENCSKQANCVAAGRTKGNNYSYLKGVRNAATANNNVESVYKLSDSPPTGGNGGNTNAPKCANGAAYQRQITSRNGIIFGVCPNTDYKGGDIANQGNIGSVEALVEACSARPDCAVAGRTKANNYGYLKGTVNGATVNNNVDSVVRIGPAQPADPTQKAKTGEWSAIVKFPVIPVGAFMVASKPRSNRLMAFSAFSPDQFGGNAGYTQYADYNLDTGAVSQRTVANTGHDMFCPGISTMQGGKVIITGGSNAERTSIYDPATNAFISGPNMQKARGYQASITLSSGKVFTMGGSWSGGVSQKDGEIYDPATNRWTYLPGALVRPSLTNDAAADKRDNHQWFYGWRDNSIFQAGPSKAMNWYSANGQGSVTGAGTRDNTDAMNGWNVMFDALRGKIVSGGGAPNYDRNNAIKNANLITIGNVGGQAQVQRLPDMSVARAYATAVVLPDGTVLITGGQTIAYAFTDTNSNFVPELFDPKTNSFRQMSSITIPRNYHSTGLLMPDGRVFIGGGGLCVSSGPGDNSANCDRNNNHLDAQIFSPPYLFNADGSAATRPDVVALSSNIAANGYSVRAGGTLSATLNVAQQGTTFSLIRMGTSTHTVNTDQRRLPLETITQNGNTYTITLPNDYGILTPGEWYLFAISPTGTPSIARTLSVVL